MGIKFSGIRRNKAANIDSNSHTAVEGLSGRKPFLRVLNLTLLAALLLVAPLAADTGHAVNGQVGVAATSFPVEFPDTPVNTTAFIPCYYVCFETQTNTCNFSGVVGLAQLPALPFRAQNF